MSGFILQTSTCISFNLRNTTCIFSKPSSENAILTVTCLKYLNIDEYRDLFRKPKHVSCFTFGILSLHLPPPPSLHLSLYIPYPPIPLPAPLLHPPRSAHDITISSSSSIPHTALSPFPLSPNSSLSSSSSSSSSSPSSSPSPSPSPSSSSPSSPTPHIHLLIYLQVLVWVGPSSTSIHDISFTSYKIHIIDTSYNIHIIDNHTIYTS